jgi:hypothetical protein
MATAAIEALLTEKNSKRFPVYGLCIRVILQWIERMPVSVRTK